MKPLMPVLVALLALLRGSAFLSSGNGNARAAEPRRFAVTIKNGKVEPAQKLIRVTRGDAVELEFSTDEEAELHLHGYDRLIKVEPAMPTVLHLDATIAGRFPIEAHGFASGRGGQRGHVVLLYLEVHPR
jgi:hypothetical protein